MVLNWSGKGIVVSLHCSILFLQHALILALLLRTDLERLRSQAALAAFLSELGEAVEQAELVHNHYNTC